MEDDLKQQALTALRDLAHATQQMHEALIYPKSCRESKQAMSQSLSSIEDAHRRSTILFRHIKDRVENKA